MVLDFVGWHKMIFPYELSQAMREELQALSALHQIEIAVVSQYGINGVALSTLIYLHIDKSTEKGLRVQIEATGILFNELEFN